MESVPALCDLSETHSSDGCGASCEGGGQDGVSGCSGDCGSALAVSGSVGAGIVSPSARASAVAMEFSTMDELTDLLSAIVKNGGEWQLLRALLRVVPAERVMNACELIVCRMGLGDEPIAQLPCGDEGWWESPPTEQPQVSLPLNAVPSVGQSSSPSIFQYGRCWFCEPFRGRRQAEKCIAMRTLECLEYDIDEQEQKIGEEEEELQDGQPSVEARRAARYFLYRKYVYAAHGKLGKNIRVRIPLCVIEYIRSRFREPGCECVLGGPLGRCREHGYTGHREAPNANE